MPAPTVALLVTIFSIVGTLITASVAVPQLVRIWRTHLVRGVSASTVALTAVAAAAWAAYAMNQNLAILTVSSLIALAANVPMLALLRRADAWSVRSQVVSLSLAVGYTAISLVFGWAALGLCLVVHVVIQYTPQIVVALRGGDLSGLSTSSAVLLFCNGITWGVVGVFSGDHRLLAWAVVVMVTGAIVWIRVASPWAVTKVAAA